jgi:hypothetical protein
VQWNPRDSTASIPIFLATRNLDASGSDPESSDGDYIGEEHGLGLLQTLPYDVSRSERGT